MQHLTGTYLGYR